MIRKIITIDEEKCTGCGVCVAACHEGAIVLRNGKAKLLRDDYCDGLGDCLPVCPADAVTIVEREALPYDEAAVREHIAVRGMKDGINAGPGRSLASMEMPHQREERDSCLAQWPVQIRLVPVSAPYFNGADLLVAADCTAFARADFHAAFMRGKVTIIGCPKLDACDYGEKLTEILTRNDVRSVTVARMSVPCCGGMEQAVVRAVRDSEKSIRISVATFSPQGRFCLA